MATYVTVSGNRVGCNEVITIRRNPRLVDAPAGVLDPTMMALATTDERNVRKAVISQHRRCGSGSRGMPIVAASVELLHAHGWAGVGV
ncbi:MAG: hypothetical protein IPK95_05160 [Cellvibrionales bacterium]|nr:hypothetical protein [Cellvibrionales bacterium]